MSKNSNHLLINIHSGVRIEEWLEQNPSCDIRDCQLILQQVINTLATLYQSPDATLTFFGGYQGMYMCA